MKTRVQHDAQARSGDLERRPAWLSSGDPADWVYAAIPFALFFGIALLIAFGANILGDNVIGGWLTLGSLLVILYFAVVLLLMHVFVFVRHRRK